MLELYLWGVEQIFSCEMAKLVGEMDLIRKTYTRVGFARGVCGLCLMACAGKGGFPYDGFVVGANMGVAWWRHQ